MASERRSHCVSIGSEAAIALAESGFWETLNYRERAEFQMVVRELSMPFEAFHEALEKALDRPVWTHELGLNFDGIWDELFHGKAAPSMQEIIDLIPEDKRILYDASASQN